MNLESACKACHDGAIQRGERAGNYANELDLREAGLMPANVLYPRDLQPSAVPLVIVTGPPAAGKSRYVAECKQLTDVVIDVDAILAELAGTSLRSNEAKRRHLQAAMIERNRRLHALAHERSASGAWFIVSAASGSERAQWARKLGAVRVLVLETPAQECIARIQQDPDRASIAADQANAVHDWWARYTPCPRDEVIEWG